MSRTVATALAVVLFSFAVSASSFAQSRTVAVYVEAAGPNPLAEQVADSVKDLRAALTRQSGLRLVDSTADADIVLRVQGREWRDSVNGSTSWGSADAHASAPIYSRWAWLKLELRAGTFTDTWSIAGKSWRGSADRAAERLTEWVASNRRFVDR